MAEIACDRRVEDDIMFPFQMIIECLLFHSKVGSYLIFSFLVLAETLVVQLISSTKMLGVLDVILQKVC